MDVVVSLVVTSSHKIDHEEIAEGKPPNLRWEQGPSHTLRMTKAKTTIEIQNNLYIKSNCILQAGPLNQTLDFGKLHLVTNLSE